VIEVETGQIEAPFEVEANDSCGGKQCVVLPEVWDSHKQLHPAMRTQDGGIPVDIVRRGPAAYDAPFVPNGSIALPFRISEAGSYELWFRTNFHCAAGDSLFFSMDTDPPVDTDGVDGYDVSPPHVVRGPTAYRRWKWRGFRTMHFELAVGRHVLRIFPREDGIRIDQVLIAKVPPPPFDEYLPFGIEEPRPD
jgi:hypothetical protein